MLKIPKYWSDSFSKDHWIPAFVGVSKSNQDFYFKTNIWFTVCPECDEGFSRKDRLKTHIIDSHLTTEGVSDDDGISSTPKKSIQENSMCIIAKDIFPYTTTMIQKNVGPEGVWEGQPPTSLYATVCRTNRWCRVIIPTGTGPFHLSPVIYGTNLYKLSLEPYDLFMIHRQLRSWIRILLQLEQGP